jgi:hypothetical protein
MEELKSTVIHLSYLKYLQKTRASLEAENKRLKTALKEIVRDEVLYLDDAYSMIEIAREALEKE